MSLLKTFTVIKLWGEKDVTLSFHEDINFLIGTNGSGKTTIINLIAAALSGDFSTLDRINFAEVRIVLTGANAPTIEIVKTKDPNTPFFGIKYRYKTNDDLMWKEYSLENIESALTYRQYARHGRRPDDPIEALGIDVDLSWLSIHRAPSLRPNREDRGYESTVDLKLDQLSNALTRLFSQFKSKGDEQTAVFQKSLFLALLPPPEWQLFYSVKALDLEKEQQTLREIFRSSGVPLHEYAQKLDEQFQTAKNAVEKDAYSERDLIAVAMMWSVHRVVQEWGELQARLAAIYKPREDFLKVINEMFRRKRLFINERNEMKAEILGGRSIGLTELSSGEKQLVIILGEALLQQKAPWIYIADEPELSLHVNWQERLTENLRQINPAAQIIFATHSPDIVGKFEDKIFDLENILA